MEVRSLGNNGPKGRIDIYKYIEVTKNNNRENG